MVIRGLCASYGLWFETCEDVGPWVHGMISATVQFSKPPCHRSLHNRAVIAPPVAPLRIANTILH